MRALARRLVVLGFSIASVMAAAPAGADSEETIKAFSAWQGRGQVFETSEFGATFVGSFSGIIYVETEKGPLDAGFMICPAIVTIDMRDGSQDAKGRCTIVAKDSSRAYADIACKGVHLVGCDGDFTFTGGTERFAGITGGGPVTIRSSLHEIPAGAGNVVQESAGGIIVWPKLTYKLPEPAAGAQ